MDLLSQFSHYGGQFFGYIVPFLFVLTIVVFFHELGHFLVARWCGVTVKAFSIGFGKEIFGFNDKKGTRWKFCWIPLGGYVKFLGDENAASVPDQESLTQMSEEEKAGAFQNKPLLSRAAVVAAGPIANFILAIVIFAFMFTFVGQRITTAKVDVVVEDSVAAKAGFLPGDIVRAINDQKIESFSDMQRIVSVSADIELTFQVDRAGQNVILKATPKRHEMKDPFGNKVRVGLLGVRRQAGKPQDWVYKTYDPLSAVHKGVSETYFVISHTLKYIGGIFTGRESADQLGGPIRIAQVSGEVAKSGILALINLAAILSISIGLLNLFPVPMLDGGHLLFYAVEAVRGRPLSDKAQEIGFRIGLAMVLMLMVFATWNDVSSLSLFSG